MEVFLKKIVKSLSFSKSIALIDQNNIKPLLLSDFFDKNKSSHNNKFINKSSNDNNYYKYNMHIWFSPEIVNISAYNIFNRLIKIYPKQKQKLISNLYKFRKNISQNNKQIVDILKSSKNKGYFVFHDAYNYFEKYYNLFPLGYFTINPEIQPSAQKLYKIRTQIIKHEVKCIFLEPQFKQSVINSVIRNINVNIGILDPLGIGIPIKSDSYMKFLIRLSKQYASCLNKT